MASPPSLTLNLLFLSNSLSFCLRWYAMIHQVSACAVNLLSVRLFVTPWTVARQAPLSTGFSRQECWSGFLFHSPEGLPSPRMEPLPFASPLLTGKFFTTSTTWEALNPVRVHAIITLTFSSSSPGPTVLFFLWSCYRLKVRVPPKCI